MFSPARWLIPALLAPALLAAQQPDAKKPDSTPHKASRLFRAKDPVTVWLQSDFKTVFKDRDTNSLKTGRYTAALRFVDQTGDTVSADVQLATRGSFRLARAYSRGCDFPPLKVYFDKEKTKGSLFGGEGSLKLVTHCRNNERESQNTYVEYAIYRMYNALTPISLKARLSSVTWLNPKDPKFTVTRPGIWLQDDDDLAKEFRGKTIKQQGAHAVDMEPRQMAITDVFEYMIGNTDFSLWALHNFIILQTDTSTNYYPLAYDFDWAGLIDAPYAFPDPIIVRMGARRVTDRVFRGATCHPPELLGSMVSLFRARKDSIYGTLQGIDGLAPARLKQAHGYLDEFYKELADSARIIKMFRRPCERS